MLREADLLGDGTDAEAYLRVAAERYRLILTHEWNDDVIQRLREPGQLRGRRRQRRDRRRRSVRLAPVAGSKTWMARVSTHSSAVLALARSGWRRRGGRRSGRRRRRCRPGPSRAASSSSSALSAGPPSSVK